MQNRRGTLYLILAVISGLSAVLLARNWLQQQIPIIPVGADTTPVIVASEDVPAGTALDASQIEVFDWPADHIPEGVIRDPNQTMGRVLKRAIIEGEPVLESTLLAMGAEAGLHALIGPSRRAMSIKVDAVVGVAGWIKPGTRVDVLATVRRIDWDRPLPYSKVILQDVKVLAIDQKLEEADEGEAEIVSVVTLEVDPPQAQRLAFATAEGTVQLALRNPEDSEVVHTQSVTVSDVMPVHITNGAKPAVANKPRSNGRGPTMEVIRGSNLTKQAL